MFPHRVGPPSVVPDTRSISLVPHRRNPLRSARNLTHQTEMARHRLGTAAGQGCTRMVLAVDAIIVSVLGKQALLHCTNFGALAAFSLRHLLICCPRVAKRAAPGLVIPTKHASSKTDRFRGAVAYVQAFGLKAAAHAVWSCYQPRWLPRLSAREFRDRFAASAPFLPPHPLWMRTGGSHGRGP